MDDEAGDADAPAENDPQPEVPAEDANDNEVPSEDGDEEAQEPSADEDAAPAPEEAEEVVEPEPTTKPRSLRPISDVLYAPDPVSSFAGRRRASHAGAEWAIENYVLWDGSVVVNGTVVEPDYEDGYYVIVMEPCREDTAVYNSFLGFASTTKERDPYPGKHHDQHCLHLQC